MFDLNLIKENPELAESINLTLPVSDLLSFARHYAESLKDPSPPIRDPEMLLTADETAEFLKVSRVTLWSWAKKGILKPLKIGHKLLYKKSDILAAMERRTV